MMHKVFVLLTMVSSAFSCEIFTFEEGFDDLFSSESGFCSHIGRTWTIGTFKSINMDGFHERSTQFIYPKEQISCVSSPFYDMIPHGTIEVNVFMANHLGNDLVQVLVLDEDNADAGTATQWGADFDEGWGTIQITILGNSPFRGLISILGMASAHSTVLVDSFRYLPPGISESDCLLYEINGGDGKNVTTDGTIIDTTDVTIAHSTDSTTDNVTDNNTHGITDVTNYDTTTGDANSSTDGTTFAVTDDTTTGDANSSTDGTTFAVTDDTTTGDANSSTDVTIAHSTDSTTDNVTDNNTHGITDVTNYDTTTGDANSSTDVTIAHSTDSTTDNVTDNNAHGITDVTNYDTTTGDANSSTDGTTFAVTDDTTTGDANSSTDVTTFAVTDDTSDATTENISNDSTYVIPTESTIRESGEDISTSPTPICNDGKDGLLARLKMAILVAVNVSAEVVVPNPLA